MEKIKDIRNLTNEELLAFFEEKISSQASNGMAVAKRRRHF
jgi:secreted Zn-dependent insulinase-like peptidase